MPLLKFKDRNLISVPIKIILTCSTESLIVGGEDTAHGALPRLVYPPTGDN
ncbi:MAG TPA: hypothetical protein VFI29_00815 [Hanamia sp.]|nr:hypothetical protein [Hanamia sp.]